MDKTTLGLLAAVTAMAATPALAEATQQILHPRTVAELLEPIAQPVATLATLDAARKLEGVEVADADVNLGPLGVVIGHRHHHHHHYHHHHHHHHYHHHHHHHYNNY